MRGSEALHGMLSDRKADPQAAYLVEAAVGTPQGLAPLCNYERSQCPSELPTRASTRGNVRLRTNVPRKLNGRGFVVAREETEEHL